MKQIKIAFIGTGNIAYQHMNSLKSIPLAKIVGLYDLNRDILTSRGSEFGVQTYSSIDQMLDRSKPDAVYICVPPYAHGTAERTCIQRRIPFLVEKPLTNDIHLAEQIAEEVEASGIITSAAYMNRYRQGVNMVKDLIKDNPISLISGAWLFNTPINHPWITNKKLSGGQLLEQSTHLFDTIRYIGGEISEVHCYGSIGLIAQSDSNYDIEDSTVVSLKLKSGAVANIQSSWATSLDQFIYLNIFGPKIQAQFKNWDLDLELKTTHKPEGVRIKSEDNIFVVENTAFLEAINNDDSSKIKSNYQDGLASLQISIAALESLKIKKSIIIT
jgi:myo-inositol 2-dehydrogenase / D-chiro-inositol 1-dehydrogenase